jgi:hypothetical protein
LHITEQLIGELNLSDFTYEYGVEVYLYPHLDNSKLTIINRKGKVINLINAQE